MAIISTFFKDLLISFMIWGLSIAPNSTYFLRNYQYLTYIGREAVLENVKNAINEKDEEAIFEMFCDESKEQPEELKKQIKEFLGYFDSKIVEDYFIGNNPRSRADFGAVTWMEEDLARLYYLESGHKLRVDIRWKVIDSQKPRQIGLCCLSLFSYDEHPTPYLTGVGIPLDGYIDGYR